MLFWHRPSCGMSASALALANSECVPFVCVYVSHRYHTKVVTWKAAQYSFYAGFKAFSFTTHFLPKFPSVIRMQTTFSHPRKKYEIRVRVFSASWFLIGTYPKRKILSVLPAIDFLNTPQSLMPLHFLRNYTRWKMLFFCWDRISSLKPWWEGV